MAATLCQNPQTLLHCVAPTCFPLADRSSSGKVSFNARRGLCHVSRLGVTAVSEISGASSSFTVMKRNVRGGRTGVTIRAQAADVEGPAGSSTSATPVDKEALFTKLNDVITENDSDRVKEAMVALKEAGHAPSWNAYSSVSRRTTFLNELTRLGIKNAEALAVPSVRNDAAFLVTVVGTTSILAVIAGQLPGDWGFFVPYLLGGVSLVVLAVGSTAPGLFEAAIGAFSKTFPDYKERLLRHEAAHFLVAYLVGLPVVAYSLDIGKEHTNLMDNKLQKRIYEGRLEASELDKLATIAMAGLAAEGLKFDKVVGQSADLFSLQVSYACSLLKNHSASYDALMAAMAAGASVADCVRAIESASSASSA
eukprot:jgi/Mesen1/5400/ME000268S04600